MSGPRFRLLLLVLLGAAVPAAGQQPTSGAITYQVPPEPIASALLAPAPPLVMLSPSRSHIALLERAALPPIAELAEPELGLAGLKINPRNNGPSRSATFSALAFTNVASGTNIEARLPSGVRLTSARWSPDGRKLAFLVLKEDTVELWSADVESGSAQRLVVGVNAAFPSPHVWLADSSGLLVRLVPEGRGAPPDAPIAPPGPVVRGSNGPAAATQTVQNLLSNAYDETLFEYYFRSQLAFVPVEGGLARNVGQPGLVAEAQPSPDGRYILQQRLKRPYSYDLPVSAFAREIFVADWQGRRLRTIADRPLPLATLTDVPSEPRAVRWRADAPATLFWAHASVETSGDQLFLLDSPFRSEPRLLSSLSIRFQDILWGTPELAIVSGISAARTAGRRLAIDPSGLSAPRLLQERPFRGGASAGTLLEWREDIAHLTPDFTGVMVELPDGTARLDVRSGSLAKRWAEPPGDELFALLGRQGDHLLVWRRSRNAPRNLFVVSSDGRSELQLTDFRDPAPAYAGLQAKTLFYKRSDGKRLTGTLYLPPGYDAESDGPLPVLIWAYPRSVKDLVRPKQEGRRRPGFVRPSGFDDLHLLLTGRGYAVLEADMPVFGSSQSPPNDTHVQQLVANAEAAVEKLVQLGVADRNRIAVGGHSYGAAMVANLLAHSDLFRTGIALSGAYNRTLTPFGFQASEDRSFWEAPEAYLAMSPFIHADKVDEPILLFHGAADSNSGTYPMQTERFHAALAGLGRTARYVLLPAEDHHYRARESLMHVMWEIDRWLAVHLVPAHTTKY